MALDTRLTDWLLNKNADGSVTVPEVLRKYVGTDVIKK